MKRLLIVALAVSALLVPAAYAGRPAVCFPNFGDECKVRPHLIPTGAHTGLIHVHWKSWGGSEAVGYGRLIEGGLNERFNLPAKVRVSLLAECSAGGSERSWYSAITVNFGPHYGRRYLREASIGPCA